MKKTLKLNPIIYDEEHFAYRAVGSKTADAFKAGLVYKKQPNHGVS